ncbi:transcription factor HES-5-like protein [Willisornis vidua]|uniref:Transcription factor HES-5-like protein n=1 Tax=Willisornis vidua TaxID=1566151 RepID=A0ABQ9DH15_9PASS|nr:transcription factor HES-5-like protein [Willisornis vidua]
MAPSTVFLEHDNLLTPKEKNKLRKPVVEKMRRDRINSSIEQLKLLLEKEFQRHQPNSKLEKADILEMTVSYLKQQSQLQMKRANLVTAVACTDTKNTVCDCQPGHFCRSPEPEGCELCQPYTVCVPGTMVKEWDLAFSLSFELDIAQETLGQVQQSWIWSHGEQYPPGTWVLADTSFG